MSCRNCARGLESSKRDGFRCGGIADGYLSEAGFEADGACADFEPDAADAVESIRGVRGIASVEELADRVAIRVREDELSMEDLLEAVLKLGARIRMFQPEAMDMETAFMKLTEGKVA